ncbi:MAG TPA: AraC family transcriptional regulator [Candidatus Binatia bacterium]|jgi:AraC-like DNA-binding protein
MIGTFLASEIRLLLRVLERRRIDPAPILKHAGLNPALIDQPRARYPSDRVIAAWGRAAEVAGDPDLGLEFAEVYRATDFHGIAVVFMASANLRTALERLVRYHAVLNTSVKLRLEHAENRTHLYCSTLRCDDAVRRVIEEGRAAVVVDLCRSSLSETVNPAQVTFTYPRPDDCSALDGFFHSSFVFAAEEWRLSFHAEDTTRPFLASNRELARSNDHVLDEMLKRLQEDDLVSRVKRAVIDELPSGTPSEESIAKSLALSGRSLQRRLHDEHTSFTELLSSVRRDLAEQYVRDPHVPVTEISYLLGFSDLSSFSRAFKRWTGTSPASCRHRGPGSGPGRVAGGSAA